MSTQNQQINNQKQLVNQPQTIKAGFSWRKFSKAQKIVLISLGAIAVLGLVMLAWTLLDKSSPISQAICRQKVKQITEVIRQANYCAQDSDCIIVKSWGCGNDLVNQERRNEVKQKIKLLNKWCYPIANIKKCKKPLTNFSCNNGKCEFVDEQAKIITIQTDKEAYQQSENIIVTLKNNLAAPIKITDEDYISGGVAELEWKANGGWQKVNLAVLPDLLPVKDLLPGESQNYRWDQNPRMIEKPGPFPLGFYRFKFTFNQVYSVYSNEFEIQSVKQEVVITTDKTEYQREETIKITVTNNSSEVICYDQEKNCGLPFWTLSQYQKNCSRENCWQEVTQVSPCIWEDTPPAKQLTVKEKIEEDWNQSIFAVEPSMLIESPIRRVDTGKYHFEFEYWTYSPGCPRPEGVTPTALSNEFEIKARVSQMENYCQKDEDCVLSLRNDCCNPCTTEPVNQQEAENRVKWREENCRDLPKGSCPQVDCSVKMFNVGCSNNQCAKIAIKKEGQECSNDFECQAIDCSKYDTPSKEGRKPYCVEGKCKCMCYGCE